MTPDPLPPGEVAADELTGPHALDALHDALQAIAAPARLQFSQVKDIAVRRAGRWILVTVKYRGADTNEVTFRIRRAWAEVLRNRLSQVLDG